MSALSDVTGLDESEDGVASASASATPSRVSATVASYSASARPPTSTDAATDGKEVKREKREGDVGGLSLDDITGTLKLITKVGALHCLFFCARLVAY